MRFLLFSATLSVLLIGCQRPIEQVQEMQKEHQPSLVCVKDGVRLYRVWDVAGSQWVYFSTPDGDTTWTIKGDGENTSDKRHNVPGVRK